jgi:hypothetical protein
VIRLAILFLLLAISTPSASAEPTTVWEIGKYDQSYQEFAPAPRDHVFYRTGQSDWTKDWPGTQEVGSTYEVQFDLKEPPQGVFLLKLSILTYLPRIPVLQLQINGHKGFFYLHPKLSYHFYNSLSAMDPQSSSDALTIGIPAEYLIMGSNKIGLSYVDLPGPYGSSSHSSGVQYDALSLVNDPAGSYDETEIHAQVTPTIFYRRKAGHLVEILDAVLRVGQPTMGGDAVLIINGRRYTTKVAAIADFGEERLDFEIPEWTGTTQAHLEITAGRHASFDVSLTAERKWTLFVVPNTHIDVGYTDYQGKVAEAQARTLDEAADLIQKYPDFRFSPDGSWGVEQFLATRSQRQHDKVLNLVREDRIGIPAQYANLLTGYASLETLYRSLYYSAWLARTYNLPISYANTTDVPTYTGSYPSILASAGIKYWAAGANNNRGPILARERWNEKSPFWWEGPDGKKVLFWYSRGYMQAMSLFGNPPQQAAIYESLPIFLQAYSNPSYELNVALIYGTQWENSRIYPETATFATSWNQDYAYPKLQYATFSDFFRYVDEHYGKHLPTYKGDMGPYWENATQSDAYFTAENRENESDALSAEIVSTVSHTVSPDLHPPKAELEDAWKNIVLYTEHTWGPSVSMEEPDTEQAVKQLAVKDNMATQAKADLEDIANRAMSQLTNKMHVPDNTVVVFNALSWRRNALVETDLGEHQGLLDLTTHEEVPVEVLFHKEGFMRVRFVAGDLPAVGYKCFRIQSINDSAPAEPPLQRNSIVENQYYRIKIDTQSASIESIFDKQVQRELVDSHSPYKFGQYLYVTGTEGETRMIHPYALVPTQLTIHPAQKGQFLGVRKFSWGYSIQLRYSDVNSPAINLEILLYDLEKKIEFRYRLQKDYTTAKEAAYFAFPIAASTPQFAYATQQGWVDPAKDMLKGANVEWFSVQKWMAVYDSGLAVGIVPVDAPVATFGDINRGEWPTEFHPKNAAIFSYIMNNFLASNWRPGQGGNFTLRYVLTSTERLDPVQLTRLGWESMEPPVLDQIVPFSRLQYMDKITDPETPLPPEGTSFLSVSAGNVALVAWKLAEDGYGTILRFQEIEGIATQATIRLPHATIHSASLCNAVEKCLQDLKPDANRIRLTFHPNEVLTIRVASYPDFSSSGADNQEEIK